MNDHTLQTLESCMAKGKAGHVMYIRVLCQFASGFTADFVKHLVTRGKLYNVS